MSGRYTSYRVYGQVFAVYGCRQAYTCAIPGTGRGGRSGRPLTRARIMIDDRRSMLPDGIVHLAGSLVDQVAGDHIRAYFDVADDDDDDDALPCLLHDLLFI